MSYKLAGVIWNDDGTMKTELTPLQALERVKKFFPFTINELEYQNICIIETALKEYECAKKHIEALNKERIENSIKLKALDIIKEKGTLFFVSDEGNPNTTEEERKILKEVLL